MFSTCAFVSCFHLREYQCLKQVVVEAALPVRPACVLPFCAMHGLLLAFDFSCGSRAESSCCAGRLWGAVREGVNSIPQPQSCHCCGPLIPGSGFRVPGAVPGSVPCSTSAKSLLYN